jgi:hypothetical protein
MCAHEESLEIRYAILLDDYAEANKLMHQMQFIPIPKRVMTAEQINEFRNLVTAHVSDTFK